MTDKFSPSGDAAPIPALPNDLDLKYIEDRLASRYMNITPMGTRLQILKQDIRQLLAEVDRLRALVPSPLPSTILEQFDFSVASVHLLDGPRPSYEFYDKAEWHTRGIRQGLKIARTILEETLKIQPAPRTDVDARLAAIHRCPSCKNKGFPDAHCPTCGKGPVASEEMIPHAFNSRTPHEPGDDRDIWCKDCEYHRDHEIHRTVTRKCPTCESPDPHRHPSMQPGGGEVQPCGDPWHKTPTNWSVVPSSQPETPTEDRYYALRDAVTMYAGDGIVSDEAVINMASEQATIAARCVCAISDDRTERGVPQLRIVPLLSVQRIEWFHPYGSEEPYVKIADLDKISRPVVQDEAPKA